MRTYSHVLLTRAAARRLRPEDPAAASWAAGAAFPDAAVISRAAWLFARRRTFSRSGLREEACAKGYFAGPDAALHSALPVAALLVLCRALGPRERRRAPGAFLLGWLGHVLTDALSHAEDARPVLWPLSRRRFRGPLSYWDRSRHAAPFAAVEHDALLVLAARAAIARSPGG